MENIYIFGHKKPDTDSVTSAITLSYLKNVLGYKTSPRVLGHLSNETKFVLDYFNVPEPKYLNDVKLQLKDINYHKDFYLNEKSSIHDCYKYMNDNKLTGLPLIDDCKKFKGLVTIKDIVRETIEGNYFNLNTSYDNIVKVLNGTEILKYDHEISGELMVASYRSTTFIDQVILTSDMILIVGDRHSIIEYAVNAGVKMIIIVGNGEIKEEHLAIAKKKKVNIIRTLHNTFHVAKLINLSNYISTIVTNDNPVSFDSNDFVNDFLEINNKLKHTNYPVLNKNRECLGLLRITDIQDKHRKQVILVDHNEKSQSVDGLEEAEIVEIVDHHKLGDLTTSNPINFRSMAVGSTNTIIYNLYKESNIEIPRDMAGLMLSGIISDTLLFKSPTTTSFDKEAVEDLAKICDIDYYNYGIEMFKKGATIKGKTKEEVLYTDFKIFNVEDKKIGIGQIFMMNFDEIEKDIDEYVKLLDDISEANQYHLVALYITDIIKNGSYVLYNRNAKNIMETSFNIDEMYEGYYMQDLVSRKKQIIPYIIETLDKK